MHASYDRIGIKVYKLYIYISYKKYIHSLQTFI